jgi:hypothetical protein
VPGPSLRKVIEAFDAPELASAWTDDTTLGWVYQFWNDPEREALDAKLNDGGKVEPHEIASKTQMFTERYMVEWLLHNSLGQTWLCMCKKHGWTPDAHQALGDLDRRRAAWRDQRERREVPLDALMPIHSELEDRWKYWVPRAARARHHPSRPEARKRPVPRPLEAHRLRHREEPGPTTDPADLPAGRHAGLHGTGAVRRRRSPPQRRRLLLRQDADLPAHRPDRPGPGVVPVESLFDSPELASGHQAAQQRLPGGIAKQVG